MSIRIDKEMTIQKERMIFKRNWEYYFDKIAEIIIYSFWTVSTIALLLNPKNEINQYAAIALISVNILVLISWYYIYKLVKIEIPNPEINRKLFVEIVSKKFPDLQINDKGLNSLRSKKNIGLFNWGKSLTIFFDQNYVFINVTTFGRFETKSPLHSIVNYLKLKGIENDFYATINGSKLLEF
ncbi:hypothetical protein LNP27_03615 [Flavobacterium galactosidilyticum]|uniref:hypothetical protein n=1 Tax=Flavobacterium galactosidilyticum TaxID=2893886 RepID=UPI001E4209DC|nr:hypothetical protein [Flavobacterium sp. F-340]UFH47129.1 hypothetical protein LNP27_03615 [Flavobacterium sp. F-340]